MIALATTSLALTVATSHAGWGIYHKTDRPRIDLQIASPRPSQEEIDLDCERRTNVGIGEEVALKVLPKDLPDVNETVWSIMETTGEVEATLTLTESKSTDTPQPIVIASAQGNASPVVVGPGATFQTKVKKIDLGAYAVVRATLKNGDYAEIVFNVAQPRFWYARNRGPNETFFFPESEWPRHNTLAAEITITHWWLCSPSDVNFEKVFFREIDLGSPMELKPLPSAENLWGHIKHPSGESDGRAHQIDYEPGIGSIPDGLGYVFVEDNLKKKRRRKKRKDGSIIPPTKDPSTQEVKNAIDTYGMHSFHFDCGYYLYDSEDENRTQVLSNSDFCMRPTKQKFQYGKIPPDCYFTKIVKFNAVNDRKVCESRYIVYHSTPTDGWISD